MSFDYDAPVPDDAADAVAAAIGKVGIPDKESDEDREQRIALFELNESIDRERRAEAQARYEFQQQLVRERQQQEARAAAAHTMKERLAQQERDRAARLDRERIAAITAQQQADQARRQQEAREQAASQYWRELDALAAGLDRLCTPAPRDLSAERIAALEYELECQANQQAADTERARSARYRQDQLAAIAKREAGGWR
jgi:hypothetical protein